MKNRNEILNKLGIDSLNDMQKEAISAIGDNRQVILLSPTGTGKTLAFLLPLIEKMDPDIIGVQTLILVPSRELAIQIEQVARDMGSGFKVNAFYGGRSFSKDKLELDHPPSILIGTPGRIADHLRRDTFSTTIIKTVILDEFDKSLEVGFEEEMFEIISALPALENKILTSATSSASLPAFVGLKSPKIIDYLSDFTNSLSLKIIESPKKDKLPALCNALLHLQNKAGIVFCNFRDAAERVSQGLSDKNISHGLFHGGMEQIDRERTLIKFRNQSINLIVSTDLAARGIDIPELDFIIHYHLPARKHEFIHRNGRTARMNAKGTAYILKWMDETLPDYIPNAEIHKWDSEVPPVEDQWVTVFVSGGRKDKISKGDIAGLFYKQGKLRKDQLGTIELKQDCAFVAVHRDKVQQLITLVDNSRLKKKKVRVKKV
ncbi:DEAD/DEAH box helicase [Membranihabitans maritimus]|uniref:DEAD/DEAH box helicase n=1 Tax=Membranihabitans maritimus TaxID=2904244 RepID=UPI001F321611|nr:DEAD/DEAH box helicase [Membranihabitans maritimus]